MTSIQSYCPWDAQCGSLLDAHPELDALCVCDHDVRVLGSAFKHAELENITKLDTYQMKPLLPLLGAAKANKTNLTFLYDRFLVVGSEKDGLTAKSETKSLFFRVTGTLYILGISMDPSNERKHEAAYDAACAVQDYFKAAYF
ncbi:hypothetical protein PHET_04651 [Paragonimus heterotremus]|uniref:Profilin n=1 Tax=Paragonimus heterotremus TaxID=100268 RepID=A0A8J4X0J5_9TREM|nr:hypothetical protein PHET_04651 [Paragonimus heterotremus]